MQLLKAYTIANYVFYLLLAVRQMYFPVLFRRLSQKNVIYV